MQSISPQRPLPSGCQNRWHSSSLALLPFAFWLSFWPISANDFLPGLVKTSSLRCSPWYRVMSFPPATQIRATLSLAASTIQMTSPLVPCFVAPSCDLIPVFSTFRSSSLSLPCSIFFSFAPTVSAHHRHLPDCVSLLSCVAALNCTALHCILGLERCRCRMVKLCLRSVRDVVCRNFALFCDYSYYSCCCASQLPCSAVVISDDPSKLI